MAADSDVAITMDIRQVRMFQRALGAAKREGVKVDKPLKKFKTFSLKKSKQMFDKSNIATGGGRDEVKWKKLAKTTIKARKKNRTGTRILKIKGSIQKSLRAKLITHQGMRTVLLFTKHPIARIHHAKARGGRPQRKIVFYTRPEIQHAIDLVGVDRTKAIARKLRKMIRKNRAV
jgi:hypothetical protein